MKQKSLVNDYPLAKIVNVLSGVKGIFGLGLLIGIKKGFVEGVNLVIQVFVFIGADAAALLDTIIHLAAKLLDIVSHFQGFFRFHFAGLLHLVGHFEHAIQEAVGASVTPATGGKAHQAQQDQNH